MSHELTADQIELHFRVGTALGLPADRPRPTPPWVVRYPILTDLEKCEVCGVEVVAVLGPNGPSVREVLTATTCRDKEEGRNVYRSKTVAHLCHEPGRDSAGAPRPFAAPDSGACR